MVLTLADIGLKNGTLLRIQNNLKLKEQIHRKFEGRDVIGTLLIDENRKYSIRDPLHDRVFPSINQWVRTVLQELPDRKDTGSYNAWDFIVVHETEQSIDEIRTEYRQRKKSEQQQSHKRRQTSTNDDPPPKKQKRNKKPTLNSKKQKRPSLPHAQKMLLFNYYTSKQAGEMQCLGCAEKRLLRVDQWHAAHINAHTKGGTLSLHMLVPMCAECNNNNNNTQNQLDYIFRTKRPGWKQRLITIILKSREIYRTEFAGSSHVDPEIYRSLRLYALRYLGDTQKGGIETKDIFDLLQRYDDLHSTLMHAKNAVDRAIDREKRRQNDLTVAQKELEEISMNAQSVQQRFDAFINDSIGDDF